MVKCANAKEIKELNMILYITVILTTTSFLGIGCEIKHWMTHRLEQKGKNIKLNETAGG